MGAVFNEVLREHCGTCMYNDTQAAVHRCESWPGEEGWSLHLWVWSQLTFQGVNRLSLNRCAERSLEAVTSCCALGSQSV